MSETKSSSFTSNYYKELILTTLFIGLAYLWTSSAYLAWSAHLIPLASSNATYLATEVGGCLMQALGILLFILLIRRDTKIALSSPLIIYIMLIDGFCFLPVAFSAETAAVLTWGLVMNLFHGAIAAFYITKLSFSIDRDHRALSFGCGYILGTIGSYLLSLIQVKKEGLFSTWLVWLVLFFLILANCSLAFYMRFYKKKEEKESPSQDDLLPDTRITRNAVPASVITLISIVVILLGLTNQLLFFFPAQECLTNAKVLESTHFFYAFGLLLAAFINTKKRSAGLILALLFICFPLLSLSLYRFAHLLTILAIIGYATSGFFTLYRIVAFTDLYDEDNRIPLLALSSAGLLFGRIGEAAGAGLGFAVGDKHILLTILTALFFAATIIIVFLLYVRLYGSKPATTQTDRSIRFYNEYDLSTRERQVFPFLIDGKTNQEIAASLYISENTVKFHVKNILKKTGCQKRTEIIKKFQSYV